MWHPIWPDSCPALQLAGRRSRAHRKSLAPNQQTCFKTSSAKRTGIYTPFYRGYNLLIKIKSARRAD